MRDTHFFLPPDKGARGQGHYVTGPRRSFSGGAGLVSTARDYARFLQVLLNGGELGGVRLLAPKTVALMTTNQVGTLFSREGEGFSLSFRTLERAGARGRVESVGTFGWGARTEAPTWIRGRGSCSCSSFRSCPTLRASRTASRCWSTRR